MTHQSLADCEGERGGRRERREREGGERKEERGEREKREGRGREKGRYDNIMRVTLNTHTTD